MNTTPLGPDGPDPSDAPTLRADAPERAGLRRSSSRTWARVAAAAALGAGLSLAAVAPAQAVSSGDGFRTISHPRPGCTYSHHIVGGHWRGTAYQCDPDAAGTHTYQARVVCRDDIAGVDRIVVGPTVREPRRSVADCPQRSGPTRGGYRDPA